MLKQYIGRSLGATLVIINLALAGCTAVTTAPAPAPTAAATVAPQLARPTAEPARPTSAAEQPAAQPAAAEVAVSDVRVLHNALGQAMIAGTVVNGTAGIVAQIQLSVTATDAAGDTLIKEEWTEQLLESAIFEPLRATLGPGESAPFAFRIYEGEPADFAVAVADYAAADANPPEVLALEHAQFVTDMFGEQHLVGQVSNTVQVSQSIQSLFAAVYDADGVLLAVEDADIMVHQLEAAGSPVASAPIDINLGALPGEPATYAIYADTDSALPARAGLHFSDAFHTYLDPAGHLHLVGMVGNPTDKPVSADLTAGLYDADGVVLDRTGGGLYWLRLPAGASVPYDFSDFGLVDTIPELLARVDHYSVQIDPQYTYPADAPDIAITSADDALAASGDSWEVTGAVLNDADQTMGRLVVIAALHDAAGNPIVTGYKILDTFDGAGLAPGQRADYAITLDPDGGVDPATLTLKTYVYATPAQ